MKHLVFFIVCVLAITAFLALGGVGDLNDDPTVEPPASGAESGVRVESAQGQGISTLPGRGGLLAATADQVIIPAGVYQGAGVTLYIGVTPTPPPVTPTDTPIPTSTPTHTPPPTNTPRPSATPAPSMTPTPRASSTPTATPGFEPTQEVTALPTLPAPTSTPGEKVVCRGYVTNASGLTLRRDHVVNSSTAIRVYPVNEPVIIQSMFIYQDGTNEWAFVQVPRDGAEGWMAVYYYNGRRMMYWDDADPACYDIPFEYDQNPIPTQPPTATPGAVNRTPLEGPHMLYSVNKDKAAAHLRQWGTVKGTTGSDEVVRAYKATVPGGVTVYRSLHNAFYGMRDCAPDSVSTSTWMSGLEPYWSPLRDAVDYFEFQNECGMSPQDQARRNLEAMQWANQRGYCLLLFSTPPGQPNVDEWLIMAPPVLEYALAHPCGAWPNGSPKYHEVAFHYYSIDAEPLDYWLFQRYQWLYRALPERLRKIGIWFTEWGIDWGGGDLDCAKLRRYLDASKQAYKTDGLGVVRGYHIWSLGEDGTWVNAEQCQLWGPP